MREGDMLARVGGEEFLVLLPMTELSAAMVMTERLRQVLADTSINTDSGCPVFLPASFGVAELLPSEDQAEWLRRIDTALYQAKSQGRNTFVAAS